MTPVDLRRAGPGWTVHFRCGGSAIVRSTSKLSGEQYLGFTEDDAESNWYDDGSYQRSGKLHRFDIIGLDPPPMTEAQMRDALAEIARIAKFVDVRCYTGAVQDKIREILALAERKL